MNEPPPDSEQETSETPRYRNDSVLRRVVANAGWLLGARGVLLPLALAESVLVARLLGAEAYGMLGVVMSFVAVVHQLASFRMNELMVAFMTQAIERRQPRVAAAILKAGMIVEAGTAVVAFLVAVAAAPLAARLFVKSPEAVPLIWGYGLIILCDPFAGSTRGALQVMNRFAVEAGVRVARKTVLLALVGVAFFLETPIIGIVTAYVVAGLVAGAYQTVRTHREAQRALGVDWLRAPLAAMRSRRREMARFAVFTNLGATLSLVIRESDLLWISFFRPPVEAGYYKLATSILKAPFAAGSPMTAATYPELARALASRALGRTRRLLRRTSVLAAAWVLPVSLALAVLAPWLVRVLYGAEYEPAATAIRLLLIGIAATHVVFWTRPALLALGRADMTLKIAAVNAALKVGLALTFIPVFGFLAAAAILAGLHWVGLTLSLLVVGAELRRLETASA